MIYVFYTRHLPVVEFLSIVIPLITMNNLLLIAGSMPWLVGTGFLFLVAAAYFSVGTYRHYRDTSGWREFMATMPSTVLWNPVPRS